MEHTATLHQRSMFGCTLADFMKSVDSSITMRSATERRTGLLAVAMSIASDAQEEIERGMSERARQSINRVKYLISKAGE